MRRAAAVDIFTGLCKTFSFVQACKITLTKVANITSASTVSYNKVTILIILIVIVRRLIVNSRIYVQSISVPRTRSQNSFIIQVSLSLICLISVLSFSRNSIVEQFLLHMVLECQCVGYFASMHQCQSWFINLNLAFLAALSTET